ncbi:hypothetical protein Q4E40_02670 [Pontibacter sp. BT731]|uniref:hypothetical protein n=1 Tax=Pontibacter coccineus TaxID=3063328 RepID=UPI0026E2AD0D|nr:hypothetical protein [Pontibacter sp. BT731]MDO6389016.1 hypothetical protein [Pontibacter sp. BT731]
MRFESTHGLGDLVYLATDPDQSQRMVTAVKFGGSSMLYTVSCGTQDSEHYEYELTTERNESIRLGLEK